MPRKVTTTEVEESSNDDDFQYPEHPLFPLEDGDKSIDVSYIQITRIEEGTQKYGPCVPASDLMTEQDIETRWGGGQYVIIARAASKLDGIPGRFRRHRRIHLPGLSKPLSTNPTPAEERMASPQAAQAHAALSPMADPMAFMTVMLQMQQQAAERERQASERFMTMFMGIMQGSKADSQQMMQLMLQMSTQQQQSMMQFMTATLANRGGGPEEMAKYAELLRTLGIANGAPKEGKEESPGIGKMLEDAADLVQGMVQLKNSTMPAPVAVEASQVPQTAPTGGASSLLRGLGR
jgi:hypothetical protein